MQHLKFGWLTLVALCLSACPVLTSASSLSAHRQAYSMLLEKGLIRVGMPIPENAEFTNRKGGTNANTNRCAARAVDTFNRLLEQPEPRLKSRLGPIEL